MYAEITFNETDSDLFLYDDYHIQKVDNEKVYLALARPSKEYHLADLLFRKKASIVDRNLVYFIEYNMNKKGFPKDISAFEHDKVCYIDIKTGNQNKELYQAIDFMLLRAFRHRINYETCKKEAERIDNEIKRNATVDLISGI